MPTVYLGLGSNLNQPLRQLHRAFKHLRALRRSCLHARSKIYVTKPMGVKAQSNYYNVVVGIKTRLPPHILLYNCKKIEQKQRRIHKKKWGARTVDIDILLYDQLRIDTHTLTIPHPHLCQRDFVMIPLLKLSAKHFLPDGSILSLNPMIPKTILRIY